MNNNSEQIGRYLQNEMNAEERAVFEKQLAADKDLRQELSIQKQIIRAIQTAGLKNTFAKSIHNKIINQRLIQFGATAFILAAAVFIFYAIKTNMFSGHNKGSRINTENMERFVINTAVDTIIETEEGVVFAIPAHAFKSQGNKIELEIKTAISPYNIMRQGLSTMSNGSLLQTAGMFYINGYENEKPVSLVKNIDVSVPVNKINPAMQLFDGAVDSSGNINWVNPKPIENKLRTYDITTLDFYPPDYIPTLKALQKDYTNKRYTDSLYYSFSGFQYDYPEKELDTTRRTPTSSTADKPIIIREGEGVSQPDTSKQAPGDVRKDLPKQDRYFHYEIDPSRIRAIWDKRFNNTIIATKEFEERLRFMHSLCSSEYLQVYLETLDTPLHVIDQYCADNTSGDVRKKFLEFAARKDGRVILNEGMQAKLSEYFQKKYKAYRDAAEKTWKKYYEDLARLNQIADDKRREQETRDYIRESKNFEEEFCTNLIDAYKQIGVKRNCKDTIPSNYYNFPISTPGWKNLDVYVFDAAVTRQSMSYTDPVSGKTAKLTYKEVNISIENMAQYDKVLVYLLPDSLSSFQRIEEEGDRFKENLNSLFKYDALAIAYKGTQTYVYRQMNLQPGNYIFRLSLIKDPELKGLLNNYSKQKSTELNTELEYQLFEQQEVIRQLQLQDDVDFREKILRAIFKCFGEGEGLDSTQIFLKK